MNRIHHFVNLFYEPTPEAVELYEKLKKENFLTFFVNAGSLDKSENPWISKDNNVIFEKKFKNMAAGNDRYNELTMLYFIRNNYSFPDEDYVRVSHYRMFLDLPKRLDCDIYVRPGIPIMFNIEGKTAVGSVFDQWTLCHVPEVWNLIEGQIEPENRELFAEWAQKTLFVAPCQLWCMKARLFREYFDWMFPKVQRIESLIDWDDPTFRNSYQHRQLAFVAERLFSFWIYMRMKNRTACVAASTFRKYDGFKPISDELERQTTI